MHPQTVAWMFTNLHPGVWFLGEQHDALDALLCKAYFIIISVMSGL